MASNSECRSSTALESAVPAVQTLDRTRHILAWLPLVAGLGLCVAIAQRSIGLVAATLIEGRPFCDFDIYLDQLARLSAPRFSLNPSWYYPPFAALVLWPLHRLSASEAYGAFTVLQLLAAGWMVRECSRVLRAFGTMTRWLTATGLTWLSLPVLACVGNGQVSLLLCCLSLFALTRARSPAPWLAAAISFKLYPMMYLLGHVQRRRFGLLFRVAAWVLFLGLLMPWLCFPRPTFFGLLARAWEVAQHARGPRFDSDQTVAALGMRLFYDRSHFDATPQALLLGLPLMAAAILVTLFTLGVPAWTLYCGRKLAVNDRRVVTAAILAMTLVIEPGWPHYFCILPFAQALLLDRATRTRELALCALSIGCSALRLCAALSDPAFNVCLAWGALPISALCALAGINNLAGEVGSDARA
ncbi:MAG TPA: glycosyltransferase family 87 protein [Polyangiales bacterium]|nr:glycosyltransferase family 87 protein [Polyangiales bacterium]